MRALVFDDSLPRLTATKVLSAILRALHPDVRVLPVARFEHQALLAQQFGTAQVLRHRPTRKILEEAGPGDGRRRRGALTEVGGGAIQ